MSAEDFQLIDDKTIANSTKKRDSVITYQKYGAQVKDGNQIFKFYFGEISC